MVLKCLQDDPDYKPTAVTLFSSLDKLPTANVPPSFKFGMLIFYLLDLFVKINVAPFFFVSVNKSLDLYVIHIMRAVWSLSMYDSTIVGNYNFR